MDQSPPSPADVRDNTELSRFELAVDGTAAFVTYRRAAGVISFLHAETPPALRHRGLASILAKGALDQVRARGEKILPKCAFMVNYVRSHPEYQDMLAAPLPPPSTPMPE